MASQTTKASETVTEMTAREGVEPEVRTARARSIIQRNMVWALGLGAVPFPIVDLLGITGVQLKMLKELSSLYEVKFSESIASKILGSLVAGFGSVSLGAALAGSAVKLIPGIGTLLGIAAVPVTASALTYATGRVFLMHFESGGTLLDFDPGAMREHFREEVEQGKLAAKALKDRPPQPYKAGAP